MCYAVRNFRGCGMARIGIDGDGVALDYNRHFGALWMQFFGEPLMVVDDHAYHASRYWGVVPPERGHGFWDYFDQQGWHSMPAMPGAVEACQDLASAGHEIVCVSSMPAHRGPQRLANLQSLGFPIDTMVATGPSGIPGANPKKEAIETLGLDWFVDDELRKLHDLPGVRCVLVDPGHSDCPNRGQDRSYLEMTVPTLAEFSRRLLAMEPSPSTRRGRSW